MWKASNQKNFIGNALVNVLAHQINLLTHNKIFLGDASTCEPQIYTRG